MAATDASAASAPIHTANGASVRAARPAVASWVRSPHSASATSEKLPITAVRRDAVAGSPDASIESPPDRADRKSTTDPAANIVATTPPTTASGRSPIALPATTATVTWIVKAATAPHHTQSGWVEVPLDAWSIEPGRPYQVHDLLSGARYLWQGPRNYVSLDPARSAAQIFRVRRHVKTEKEFDYYL